MVRVRVGAWVSVPPPSSTLPMLLLPMTLPLPLAECERLSGLGLGLGWGLGVGVGVGKGRGRSRFVNSPVDGSTTPHVGMPSVQLVSYESPLPKMIIMGAGLPSPREPAQRVAACVVCVATHLPTSPMAGLVRVRFDLLLFLAFWSRVSFFSSNELTRSGLVQSRRGDDGLDSS